MATERPYQTAAIAAAIARFSQPHEGPTRHVCVMPTGSGKSVVGMGVVRWAVQQEKRVFVCVHRIHLVPQWVKHAVEHGVPAGIIRAGVEPTPGALLQVGTIQTFQRRHMMGEGLSLVVADECHRGDVHKPAFSLGVDVLGLTATPQMAGGGVLADWFDTMHVAAYPSELLGQWIVPADVWAPYVPELNQVRMRGADFEERALENVMSNTAVVGNVVEHWEKLGQGLPTIAFAVSVHHANLLAKGFQERGIGAAVISGDTPEKEREFITRRFSAGSLQVLVNCAVFVEGYDLPAIGCVIMARPTMSLSLFLQMAGRGARIEPGKKNYRLLDHAGNVFRHGLPQMDRHWSLIDEDKNGREMAVRRESQGLRNCGTCFYCWSGTGSCPNCGSTAPPRRVKEQGGNLVHVEETQLAALLPAGVQAKQAIDKKRRQLFAQSKKMPNHLRSRWVQQRLNEFVKELQK